MCPHSDIVSVISTVSLLHAEQTAHSLPWHLSCHLHAAQTHSFSTLTFACKILSLSYFFTPWALTHCSTNTQSLLTFACKTYSFSWHLYARHTFSLSSPVAWHSCGEQPSKHRVNSATGTQCVSRTWHLTRATGTCPAKDADKTCARPSLEY